MRALSIPRPRSGSRIQKSRPPSGGCGSVWPSKFFEADVTYNTSKFSPPNTMDVTSGAGISISYSIWRVLKWQSTTNLNNSEGNCIHKMNLLCVDLHNFANTTQCYVQIAMSIDCHPIGNKRCVSWWKTDENSSIICAKSNDHSY